LDRYFINTNLWQKFSQIFDNNLNIISKYYFIYNKTFQQALDTQIKNNESKFYDCSDILKLYQYNEIYQNWFRYSDMEIGKLLNSDDFSKLISNYFNSFAELQKSLSDTGFPLDYFHAIYEESIRKIYLDCSIQKDSKGTPFNIEYTNNDIRLLHFHNNNNNGNDKSPLLIIYATINRYHIMDINSNRSVIKFLLSKGLDIYLLDWGYPSAFNEISLENYIECVREPVQYIQAKNRRNLEKKVSEIDEKENSIFNISKYNDTSINNQIKNNKNNNINNDKISILGYCWGGIIALIFVCLYQKYIKNLTLMATPIDLSKDKTILSKWAKAINIDKFIDQFDHFDGQILDIGFFMRNPLRNAFDKYLVLVKKYNDKEFIDMFMAVEKWLYDTPIIPGKFLKQIINECYKNNSLVKNRMKIDCKRVNLNTVTVPLLSIVAENDDLVSFESSLEINNNISSTKKRTIKVPGGHVGLCISNTAHKWIWPEAAEWILSTQ
jgi:polyhydroxyalkanoate synthase subunit PhaC